MELAIESIMYGQVKNTVIEFIRAAGWIQN